MWCGWVSGCVGCVGCVVWVGVGGLCMCVHVCVCVRSGNGGNIIYIIV